jgi:hypothetical protein
MYAAIPQPDQVRPAFTVKKLSGTVPHRVHIFDKEKNKILSKVVQEPAGYLVQFYKGHSIRCRDEAHLRRVGAHLKFIPLLDKEGEIKGAIPNAVEIEDEDNEDDTQSVEVVEEE